MSYQPKIVTPDEVRAFFQPFLSHDDIEDYTILMRIQAVEEYISKVFFNGEYPIDAKIPVLLMVASKIILEPSIINNPKYSPVKKIGDVTFFDYKSSTSPYKIARSWEEMALDMLYAMREGKWHIRLTNIF